MLSPSDLGYPGAQLGAQLSGLDPGEASADLADAFGVQNGDVIKGLNAIDIVTLGDALAAADELISASAVSLEIERDNESVLYRLPVRG